MSDDSTVDPESFPIMSVTQTQDQWLRDFIRAAVPQVASDIEAGPGVMPGMTWDEGARQFLVALDVAREADPLAAAAWTDIVGVRPLAPHGKAPVQLRWAPEAVTASGILADVLSMTFDEVCVAGRVHSIVGAACRRAARSAW